jgi:hypothetical protein
MRSVILQGQKLWGQRGFTAHGKETGSYDCEDDITICIHPGG